MFAYRVQHTLHQLSSSKGTSTGLSSAVANNLVHDLVLGLPQLHLLLGNLQRRIGELLVEEAFSRKKEGVVDEEVSSILVAQKGSVNQTANRLRALRVQIVLRIDGE